MGSMKMKFMATKFFEECGISCNYVYNSSAFFPTQLVGIFNAISLKKSMI